MLAWTTMPRLLLKSILLLCVLIAISSAVGPSGINIDMDLMASIRIPRILTAVFAGAATAAAGTLSQALFRNPLATPSVIGTEAGAAFALALATLIAAQQGAGGELAHPILYTTLGAAIATALSMTIMRYRQGVLSLGSDSVARLLLGGFAMNAMFAAGSSFCLSILMERGDGMSLYHWLMGSFSARTWDHAAGIMSSYFVCAALALRLSPTLDALSMGDEASRSIGINVSKIHTQVLILIAALIGSSLSCGGALPFVGLIAPHFARILSKPHVKVLLPQASIIGAILAVSADLAARTLRAPVDMDVGILTTLIGAPYFIWLLVSDNFWGGGKTRDRG
jgi:iron complex transport system permease protein